MSGGGICVGSNVHQMALTALTGLFYTDHLPTPPFPRRSSVGCRRHFHTSTEREAHHTSNHLAREIRKPLVPPLPLKPLHGGSHRFESSPPALPAKLFTWGRGWYVDVVPNPSASSDVSNANVPASEGVSNSACVGCVAKD